MLFLSASNFFIWIKIHLNVLPEHRRVIAIDFWENNGISFLLYFLQFLGQLWMLMHSMKRMMHSIFSECTLEKLSLTFVTTHIDSACMDHSEMIGYERFDWPICQNPGNIPSKKLRILQNPYIFFKLISIKHGISFIKNISIWVKYKAQHLPETFQFDMQSV